MKIVATADHSTHKPIVYPVGVIKDSKHPQEAKDFYQFYKVRRLLTRLKNTVSLRIEIAMIQEFLSPLQLSLKIALVAGFVVIILGTVIGKLLSRKHFKGKVMVETVLMLPLVLPPSVVGFY